MARQLHVTLLLPHYIWHPGGESCILHMERQQYGKAIQTQFDSMQSEAASGVSHKFAKRASVAPDMSTLYMLVQCSPDLSKQNCSGCLTGIFVQMPICWLESKVGECIHPAAVLEV